MKQARSQGITITRAAVACVMIIYLITCLCMPSYANGPEDDYVPDDTDGTELQIMQPSQLEIRLGSDWAGAEFELETDVGEYPGTVPVSIDGTLSMELGGSETYVLRLVETPAAPAVEATPEVSNGLPVFAIVLFGVGLVIAVGVLVAVRVITQRRGRDEEDDGENDG